MSRNPVLYKTLAIGVIVLFISVGIQPALADVSNISISDSKDDCDLCPKVSKQHIDRLKSLIDRLDTLNTRLSKVSKLNPELEEKYQEISERISTLKIINENSQICDILLLFAIYLLFKTVLIVDIFNFVYYTFFPFFSISLNILYELFYIKLIFVLKITDSFRRFFYCPDWYWPIQDEFYQIGV